MLASDSVGQEGRKGREGHVGVGHGSALDAHVGGCFAGNEGGAGGGHGQALFGLLTRLTQVVQTRCHLLARAEVAAKKSSIRHHIREMTDRQSSSIRKTFPVNQDAVAGR